MQEQTTRLLKLPVFRNLFLTFLWQKYRVFLGEIFEHFFDCVVFLDKLVRFYLTDAPNCVAVVAATQNAHVHKLGLISVSYIPNLFLGHFHVFQNFLQIHLNYARLVLFRATLTLRQVTQEIRRAERQTVHIFARHTPNHLLLH